MPMQVNAGQIKTGQSVMIDGRECRVTSVARLRFAVELDGNEFVTDEVILWYQWSRSKTDTIRLKPGDFVTIP